MPLFHPEPFAGFSVGDTVKHAKRGVGTIRDMEKYGAHPDDEYVFINYPGVNGAFMASAQELRGQQEKGN